MTNFPDFEFEGLSGGKTFNFIPTHDIDTIPYTIFETIDSDVILITGKTWFTGNSLPRSLDITEEHVPESNTYKYKVTGRLTGSDSVIMPLFKDMASRSYVLDITDMNGNRRLIGTNENGMDFTWKRISGKIFEYTFSCELIEPAKIYRPD
jgi:hypothetical protein